MQHVPLSAAVKCVTIWASCFDFLEIAPPYQHAQVEGIGVACIAAE